MNETPFETYLREFIQERYNMCMLWSTYCWIYYGDTEPESWLRMGRMLFPFAQPMDWKRPRSPLLQAVIDENRLKVSEN